MKKNLLEWTVFTVSCLLLIGLAALLLLDSRRSREPGPRLTVTTGNPSKSGAAYIVPVRIRNDGADTAEGVAMEVILKRGGEEIEKAELVIAFVPRRSTRDGAVVFRNDPAQYEISSRPLSFELP